MSVQDHFPVRAGTDDKRVLFFVPGNFIPGKNLLKLEKQGYDVEVLLKHELTKVARPVLHVTIKDGKKIKSVESYNLTVEKEQPTNWVLPK